jgi:hypothetical protein
MMIDQANRVQTAQMYQAFGLKIASCLPLPAFLECEGERCDVTVRYGAVPEELPGAAWKGVRFQAAPGRLLLIVDDVARYLVRDGREILIDRAPGASDDDVRLFLQGSAFGALLQQRGLLALHASAVAVGEGAVAFMGPSGIGKSTLATAFHQRGYTVLTDDVCVVDFDAGGAPVVVPGYPQLKLWVDALEKLDLDPASLPRIRPALEKRALLVREAFRTAPRPLRRLYMLDRSNEPEIHLKPLQGPDKFLAIQAYTYRVQFLEALARKVDHFRQAGALAAACSVVRVSRPAKPYLLDELVARLEDDFAS